MNKIEVFYLGGCPPWKPTLENLKKVIETEKFLTGIILIKIASPGYA